jgi:hypothetical protein
VEKDCQRIEQIGQSLAEAKAPLAGCPAEYRRTADHCLFGHARTLLGLWHPASHQGAPCSHYLEALRHHDSHKSMAPLLPVHTPRHGHRQPFNSCSFPFHVLNHLVHLKQERRRNYEAKGLGGLEVDDQLELGRLFHEQVQRPGPFQDLLGEQGRNV